MPNREEFIADLRAAADFFEAHPSVRTPPLLTLDVWTRSKEELAEAAKAAGRVEKHTTEQGGVLYLRKALPGGSRIDFNISRDEVCERVVTGTRVIPAHTLPAQPEMEVPEKEEEIVEWRCHPILASEAEEAQIGGAA